MSVRMCNWAWETAEVNVVQSGQLMTLYSIEYENLECDCSVSAILYVQVVGGVHASDW